MVLRYTYVHTYIQAYIHMYICVSIWVCACEYECTCTCVLMYVCTLECIICVCLCVCVHVYFWKREYVCIHTCVYEDSVLEPCCLFLMLRRIVIFTLGENCLLCFFTFKITIEFKSSEFEWHSLTLSNRIISK